MKGKIKNMKKAEMILIALVVAALLVIFLEPVFDLESVVLFVAATLCGFLFTTIGIRIDDDKVNGTEACTTRQRNINRQAGLSKDYIMQELQDQIRIQDDEMLRYHMSVAESTRIECEEAGKMVTPFSLGGYDMAHDIAEDQNQSFINDSFGGFDF